MTEPPAPIALSPATRHGCLLAAALAALPLLRLVPGWLALCLVALAALSVLGSQRAPLPRWLLVPLTVAAAALVFAAFEFRFGRDTGSALLLAMLALKTGETSSLRDGRALIGFSVFAVFAAFLQDQGPLTLLLALPAVGAMLSASAQLAGAQAGVARPPPVKARARQAVTAMALAVPLALTAFWLFPRLSAPLWGVPQSALARMGVSGEMSPGEWLDLMTDDSIAFRVEFDGPAPPREQLYWRGPVLWDFDGRTWSRPAWTELLAPPAVTGSGATVRYTLTMEPTERRFLFALDLPLAVPPPGRLDGDLSPMAARPVYNLLRYEAESMPDAVTGIELPERTRTAALALPVGFNPRTRERVEHWRAQGLDDEAIVERSLDWFRREFSYSLAAPPLGRHSVDEFLFDTRIGFCEHFSSAFVVTMRMAGIPARVVTGYVGGYLNPFGESWRIQQSDAHAWAEVWLPERGWVRVDPTAAVDPSRIFDRYGAGAHGGALSTLFLAEGPLQGLWRLGDYMRRNWNEVVLGYDVGRQRLLLRRFGIEQARQWQLGAVFLTIALLALSLTLWLLRRERDPGRDALLAAYRVFVRRLARAGVRKQPHETETRFAARAARDLPAVASTVQLLSERFVAARYASTNGDDDFATLVTDLRSFRIGRS